MRKKGEGGGQQARGTVFANKRLKRKNICKILIFRKYERLFLSLLSGMVNGAFTKKMSQYVYGP